jgi:carbonic anhydrase
MKAIQYFLSIMISSLFSLVFSYDYRKGGDDWTGLCQTGQNQSPINIDASSANVFDSTYFYLINNFENNFTVTNTSNEYSVGSQNLGDVFFFLPDGSSSSFNDYSDFVVRNISVHAPSEHLINNKSFDLEIQILAQFKYGKLNYSNHMLSIFCTVDEVAQETENFFETILNGTSPLNINNLVFQDQTNFKTFVYEGSLTVPPCTEKVIWFIRKTPYKISLKHLKAFRDKWENNPHFADFRGNNRNIQKLGNRTISANDGENLRFLS